MAQKEALLYEELESSKVRCLVCPRECVILPGRTGVCKTRKNVEGKLYTLIYALCSSIAADPIEKKPVFHYAPGTIALSLGTLGCNLLCRHCQNWHISHADASRSSEMLREIKPEELVWLARQTGSHGVAWTYNEPTIWLEYVVEGARACKENDLYTVLVTNGYISEKALDTIAENLDVYRVDVKGFSEDSYYKIARIKDFSFILDAAVRAKQSWGCHVEVVTNVIPTVNDSEEELRNIARWIAKELGVNTPWHVTRFVPHLEFSHLPMTPVSTLEMAHDIGREEGLKFVYLGNVPGHKYENTYCPNCGSLVIKRVGYSVDFVNLKDGSCSVCGEDLNIKNARA